MSRGSKKTGPGLLMPQVGNRARTAGWDANPSPQLELGAPPLPEHQEQDVSEQQVNTLWQGLLNSKGCECIKIGSSEPTCVELGLMLTSKTCAYMCCGKAGQVMDRIAVLCQHTKCCVTSAQHGLHGRRPKTCMTLLASCCMHNTHMHP